MVSWTRVGGSGLLVTFSYWRDHRYLDNPRLKSRNTSVATVAMASFFLNLMHIHGLGLTLHELKTNMT